MSSYDEKPVYVIIPTFNNLGYLSQCINTLSAYTVDYYRIIIVNNGTTKLDGIITGYVTILEPGKNLGWAGGINYALEHAVPEDTKYITLMNDDTMILPHDYDWMYKMRTVMELDDSVAAVGPSSNVVMGNQNFSVMGTPAIIEVPYLIGFCVCMRKDYFDQIGRMDETLPGGDDLDWSIRFRKAGYKLIARRDSFVYHHGFVTGNKLYGDHTQPSGWNSQKMTDTTNRDIIRKHSFKDWFSTVQGDWLLYDTYREEYGDTAPLMKVVEGKGIDVGCGPNKIHEDAIGVDLVGSWEEPGDYGKSQADIKASGDRLNMFKTKSLDYVVARHNLEHYANPIKTLREWNRVLKMGGKLAISMPDDGRLSSIRLDPTHRHSFNREGLKDILELTGFYIDELGGTANQWNMYVLAHKVKEV